MRPPPEPPPSNPFLGYLDQQHEDEPEDWAEHPDAEALVVDKVQDLLGHLGFVSQYLVNTYPINQETVKAFEERLTSCHAIIEVTLNELGSVLDHVDQANILEEYQGDLEFM